MSDLTIQQLQQRVSKLEVTVEQLKLAFGNIQHAVDDAQSLAVHCNICCTDLRFHSSCQNATCPNGRYM